MRIDRLTLKGFRSYEDQTFDFRDGANIVWGDNARGKTNLLEGILLLSGSSSWRTRKRGELINFYKDAARIDGVLRSRERSFDVSVRMPLRGKTSYLVNGVTQKHKYELSDYFRCVLFCPDDLSLVKGGPEKRRRFVDMALSQLRPRYAAILTEYNKLMDIKTYLFKEGGVAAYLPEVNRQMVHYGAELIRYRALFLQELSREAEIIHRDISRGLERLALSYKTVSNIDEPTADVETLRERLETHMREHTDAEITTKTLLSGPHKDDIVIKINGVEARSFASQGQARTAALSMKFGERELFRLDSGEYPVLLLDDVLSELDQSRSTYVASAAVGGQTIITCCEPPDLFKDANVIRI